MRSPSGGTESSCRRRRSGHWRRRSRTILRVVAIEQLKRFGDIADVCRHPHLGRALPERRGGAPARQTRAGQLVDSLAESDVPLSAQAFSLSSNFRVQSGVARGY